MRAYLRILLLVISITWISQVKGQDFKSTVGSPCRLNEDCVKNSECVFETCQCQPGFTVLASLECRMDYDGKCSHDFDCNEKMGLHCQDSLCKCSEHLGEEYLPSLGACTNASTKLMYEDIVNLINKTEFELSRFTTLLSIFMIHSSSNQTETSASEINPVVYQSLQALEQQLDQAEQNPIPAITTPPENNEIQQDQEARAQVESPQTTVPIPSQTPSLSNNNNAGSNSNTNLPNSINSLLNFPIIPIQGGQEQNTFSLPGQNLGGGLGGNNQIESLTNVLPNFLNMFRQFLPILQGYNNVLSSSVLQQNSQNRQGGIGGSGGGNLFGGLAGLIPGVGSGQNPLGALVNLINVPVRIIQIPGRIFNSFFGANSTLGTIKRRIIPIDFSDRPIQLLPWPLG